MVDQARAVVAHDSTTGCGAVWGAGRTMIMSAWARRRHIWTSQTWNTMGPPKGA